MIERITITEKEILLCEYNAAQDSAQHHDKEAWSRFSIFSVIISGLFAILVSTVNNVNFLIKIALSFLGMILATMLILIHIHYSFLINHKYTVCKNIEKKLGMIGNHTNSPKSCFKEYFILIMILFIILWTIYLTSLFSTLRIFDHL